MFLQLSAKKKKKKKVFAGKISTIEIENIGNSCDTSFEDLIMIRTNGKGVDYVLNSLADDKL
jgi:fatty acid synthase, animal type